MIATKPMTTVSFLYGGIECPAEQVVRLALPQGHKVVKDGTTLEEGTEVVFVVRTKPGSTGTSGYANLYLMSPGIPQMVGGCYVHVKARGRGRWIEWDGCREVSAFVERFTLSNHIHVTEMPRGFQLVQEG